MDEQKSECWFTTIYTILNVREDGIIILNGFMVNFTSDLGGIETVAHNCPYRVKINICSTDS